MPLELHNPHSVLAALETRPEDVVEVALHSGKAGGRWADVVALATRHRIPIVQGGSPRDTGRRRAKSQTAKTERYGAAHARVKERAAVGTEQLFHDVENRADGPGLWLGLDCIQDPQNVGAIFRSAAFFGIQGILMTSDRSAPLNATVYDVAAGGLEQVPFANPANLSRAIDQAKKAGLWVLGASEHAEQDIRHIDRDRPWLLILGNEEKGLRRLTQDKCDNLCRLSATGPVTSLNVAVAAGVLMATLTGSI